MTGRTSKTNSIGVGSSILPRYLTMLAPVPSGLTISGRGIALSFLYISQPQVKSFKDITHTFARPKMRGEKTQ